MPLARALISSLILAALGIVAYIVFKPDDVRVNVTGAPLVDVIVPTLSPEQMIGETAFNARCAVCHGKNAAGQSDVAPPLVHIIYEPNHHGDESFYRAATQGVQSHHWTFGDMAPVQGITNPEMQSIITYVRALQRANGIN